MMLDVSLGFFTYASALTISANFQSYHHEGSRSYLLLHEPPATLSMIRMGLIFEGEMAL